MEPISAEVPTFRQYAHSTLGGSGSCWISAPAGPDASAATFPSGFRGRTRPPVHANSVRCAILRPSNFLSSNDQGPSCRGPPSAWPHATASFNFRLLGSEAPHCGSSLLGEQTAVQKRLSSAHPYLLPQRRNHSYATCMCIHTFQSSSFLHTGCQQWRCRGFGLVRQCVLTG